MVVTPGFLIGLFVLNVLVLHWNLGVIVSDGQWDTVGWPALTLALGSAGYWARILRASVLEARVGALPASQRRPRRITGRGSCGCTCCRTRSPRS